MFDVKTMEQQIGESVSAERMVSSLSAFFGLLATLLASIGLYGVMAYMVTRRTREIGVRMALGASRGAVLKLVLSEVLLVVGAGRGDRVAGCDSAGPGRAVRCCTG
jgi:ABC-type antimicrobial peptide transport system permease subunit